MGQRSLLWGPFVEEGEDFGGAVVVAFLEFTAVLGGELVAVGVENDNDGEAEADGIAVFLDGGIVVAVVHVDEGHDVVGFKICGDGTVGLAEVVQAMAPAAPVGAELEEDAFVFLFGERECVGDLFGGVGGFVVDGRVRGFWGIGGHDGSGGESDEKDEGKADAGDCGFHSG